MDAVFLRRHGFAVGLVVLAALLSERGVRGCRTVSLTPIAQRRAASELTFTTIDDAPWRMRDHRGEVVALNLWATWCEPCRAETPTLVQLSHEFAQRGVRMVGLSLDVGVGSVERVQRFAAAYHVAYPLALADPLSQLDQAVEGLPTTLLFDREGRLAVTYVGAVRERDFRRHVEVLLQEP